MVKVRSARPLQEVVEAVTHRRSQVSFPSAHMEGLESVIGQVAPAWRHQGATGNFIASELKKIHDDSLSVFPESVYSGEGRRKGRWDTTMRQDYVPLMEIDPTSGNPHYKVSINDCGVSGALSAGNTAMFQKWKVPSRITESSQGSRASVDLLGDQLEEIQLGSPSRAPSALPGITGATPRPATVRSAAARPGTVKSAVLRPGTVKSATPAVLQPPVPRRSPRRPQPKSLASKVLLESERYRVRDERGTAERWLQQASDADKVKVAMALKVKQQDVAIPVKQWLKDSSAKEREVALTFFQSLAGTQFMGGSANKKEKVDQVIGLLRNPPNKYDSGVDTVRARMPSSQRFRHINLLTPCTRRSKQQHQTWHHLPSYNNNNKVLNNSAILTEPHSTVHRHFTIHPDWGP